MGMLLIVAGVGVPLLLGLCELWYRVLDGPFPKLPDGINVLNIYRRRLYPWIGVAVAVVALMAGMLRAGPVSWRENLSIAIWVGGVFSLMALWFFHYKARRFDYGRTALKSNPWFHWVYTEGELERWKVESGPDSEAWIGPDGLLFGGEYAPWALCIYQLVRAEAQTDPSPRLNFTFKMLSLGSSSRYGEESSSEEVMHVPIPVGRSADLEVIERGLRALCPDAEIRLVRTDPQ